MVHLTLRASGPANGALILCGLVDDLALVPCKLRVWDIISGDPTGSV